MAAAAPSRPPAWSSPAWRSPAWSSPGWSPPAWSPPAWSPLAAFGVLAVLTCAAGGLGIGLIRPLYVLACCGLGVLALRAGPERHVELAIALFALSPLLRRVVDLGTDYEPAGIMLIGPMLFILVPVMELRGLLLPGGADGRHYWPFVLVGACAVYAAVVSLVMGDFMAAASGLLKWTAPLIYGMWIAEQARWNDRLTEAASRAFLVITPLMGVYGILQYVDPPAWDRFWMIYSAMNSIGDPEAFQVRVFSTMNSPASFATFAVAGLVLVGFGRSRWWLPVFAVPSCLGLMLSLYRTSWIGLAVAIVFCACFAATRGRAILIAALMAAAVAVAVVATPFGDTIGERLGTLNQAPSEDGSGQERLKEYVALFDAADDNMFGAGFATGDILTPGVMPVDGQIVACWLAMGIGGGLLCIAGILWAAAQALVRAGPRRDARGVAVGALIAGMIAQLPLAGIASAEMGLLFWMFVGLAAVPRSMPVNRGGLDLATGAGARRPNFITP